MQRSPKPEEGVDPPELWEVVRYLTWMLRPELWSSGGAAVAFILECSYLLSHLSNSSANLPKPMLSPVPEVKIEVFLLLAWAICHLFHKLKRNRSALSITFTAACEQPSTYHLLGLASHCTPPPIDEVGPGADVDNRLKPVHLVINLLILTFCLPEKCVNGHKQYQFGISSILSQSDS